MRNYLDCDDEVETCASWSAAGYCGHVDYIDYMKANCCQSCDGKLIKYIYLIVSYRFFRSCFDKKIMTLTSTKHE